MADEATEEYAAAMEEAIASATKAEAERDAALTRVAELTRPPVCDNAGQPIAEMIYARLLRDIPGIARNEHPEIQIRLEMNSVRTDLDRSSDEYNDVCNDEVDPLGPQANEGAQALRLAIEGNRNWGLNQECVTPMNERAWRTPKELLAGPQTYIFDDIWYWCEDDDFVGFYVCWKNANGERCHPASVLYIE